MPKRKLVDLLNELNINERFTKPIKKEKRFTKISDSVTPLEDYNYMADLLFLPKTKSGYKYLLVVVDLVTRAFDIEPLKTKEANETLKALMSIFKRKYLKKPKATLRTDNGTEFKGVFDKYLKDNKIFHALSSPYRHSQLSVVESLNKQLGRIFIGYLNAVEDKTQHQYNEWDDIINIVRKELNAIRYVKPLYTPSNIAEKYEFPMLKHPQWNKPPLFKVGDIVHRKLDFPLNALGNKQTTANFRVGDYRYDKIPQKITKVLYYDGAIPYRYLLDGIKTTSFTENQLMKSTENVQKWKVKQLIGRKKIKGITYYLVWWKGYKKSEATYEPRNELLIDVPKLVKAYDEVN